MPNHETSTYSSQYLCVGVQPGNEQRAFLAAARPRLHVCHLPKNFSPIPKARSNIGRWVRILFTATWLRTGYPPAHHHRFAMILGYVCNALPNQSSMLLLDALLAGEILRVVVERRARIAFLDRQTEPAAERLPSPHATLHPWLLTFTDAKLEDEFLNEQFLRSRTVIMAVFALLIAIFSVASVFAITPFHCISAATTSVWLCTREYAGRQHVTRGRVLFGRTVVASETICLAVLCAYTQSQPAILATETMMYALTIVALVFSASLRFTGIGFHYCMGAIAICTLGFLSWGDLSTMGHPIEAILLIFGLLLGQLVGFAFESHVRHSYLSEVGLREARTRAEAREREANTERGVAQEQNAKQSDLLDRIFATSHDALMLCELPAAPEQPPTLLRCSPNTHSILGVHADADPFTAFTAEQQRAIGEDVERLAEQRFFPERIQTLAHCGVVLACSGHMVDAARFLVTLRDVTEAKRAEQRERTEETQRTMLRFQQQALLNLDAAFDLIAQLEVKDGVSTRLWSSSSHHTVLGHDPTACNGDQATLTKLYPAAFLRDELPGLIAAFERGKIADGLMGEHALLHADGHEVWFEWRLSLDAHDRHRIIVVWRDITDRRERERLRKEQAAQIASHATHTRHALALDRIADVVLEVAVEDWASPLASCRVVEANDAYALLFGAGWTAEAGAWPALCLDPETLGPVLVRADRSPHAEVRFERPDREVRVVRVSTVHLAEFGADRLLVVCHDLTDFKKRIELEKDQEAIADIQHEEKGVHKAAELALTRAVSLLEGVGKREDKLRSVGEGLHRAELREAWASFKAHHTRSYEDLGQVRGLVEAVLGRAVRAQHDLHSRIMLRQIVHDEYVPACTPVDVEKSLKEELGPASTVRVRAFAIPEVRLDWTLLAYGVDNALSNARKYGVRDEIEVALEYREPALVIHVTNPADPESQARLIATHGADATHLLHRRAEGGGSQSTNIGGKALRNVARLLHGDVGLQLLPEATRLRLEVTAPRVVDVTVSEELVVYFVDDEPMMRMQYEGWIEAEGSPLHPGSRIFPPPGLGPAAADEAMRGFPGEVLAADPRPRAVVLDQNLRSQVVRHENATTGTEIAETLRRGGYTGAIIIRSANISTKVRQEYLAAGADAAMSKDDQCDALVRLIFEGGGGAAPDETDSAESPLLAPEDDALWATMSDARRDALFAVFRSGARATLDELLALLEKEDVGALPSELHALLGQCRAAGARRMQRAAEVCKAAFGYAELARLEALLAQTFAAIDTRCGVVHEATAAQEAHAVRVAERAEAQQSSGRAAAGSSALPDPPSVGEQEPTPLRALLPAARAAVPGPPQPVVSTLTPAVAPPAPPELPLINAEQSPQMLAAFGEASLRMLDELRRAVAAGTPCHPPLHSLCGLCATVGAARLARCAAEGEESAEAFGVAQLTALEALHAETTAALASLPAPPAVAAVAAALAPAAALAAAGPAPGPGARTASLFAAGIDDCDIARAMQEGVLFPALGADMTCSRSLGETREEQEGFFNYALGRVDKELRPLAPPYRQADVIAVDQNILLEWQPHLIGTDIVARLRDAGFTGAACVISGGSPEEARRLEACDGVDVATTKGFNAGELAARLLEALARRRACSGGDDAGRSGGGGGGASDAELFAMAPMADLRTALANLNQSRSLLKTLVRAAGRERGDGLVRALEAGELDVLHREAHRLVGTMRYLCAGELVTACMAVERSASIEAARPLVGGVCEQLAALSAALGRVLAALEAGAP